MTPMTWSFSKTDVVHEMIEWTLKNTPLGRDHVASDLVGEWEKIETGDLLVIQSPVRKAKVTFTPEDIAEKLIASILNHAPEGQPPLAAKYVQTDFTWLWNEYDAEDALTIEMRENVEELLLARMREQRKAAEEMRALHHAPGSEPPGCENPGTE